MSDSGIPWTIQSMEFSRPEYWNGLPHTPPGHLPNPGIKPRCPTLQVDSLPAEPLGKPKNTGKGSLSLLQQIYPTQESNRGLLHCRQILHQLSYQRIPNVFEVSTEKRNDIQNVSVPVSNDCMLTNHHHCQKIYMYTHQDKMTYSYQLWFCVVSCQIHISP